MPTTELELAQRLVRGDPDAIAEWVAAYSDDLYRFVYHQVGGSQQDAEDIVQETFIAALKAIRSFRGDSKLRTWLFSIAAHKIADAYRTAAHRPQIAETTEDMIETVGGGAIPERIFEQSETRAVVRQGLALLPPHYRTALVLKYVEGLSVDDMAQVMRRSGKSIESILGRARRMLAQWLEGRRNDV